MDEISCLVADLIRGLDGKLSLELVVKNERSLRYEIDVPAFYVAVSSHGEKRDKVLLVNDALFIHEDELLSLDVKEEKATRSRHRWVCDVLLASEGVNEHAREQISQEDLYYWHVPFRYFSRDMVLSACLIHPEDAALIFAKLLRASDNVRDRLEYVGKKRFDKKLHDSLLKVMFCDKYDFMPYDSFAPD